MQFPRAKLLIFAKSPVSGMVKTRLEPAIGRQGALQLYRELLVSTVARYADAGLCPIECWCTPEADHDLFLQLAERYGITLHLQQGEDLGERMAHAARQALTACDSVVLVGVDCPVLTAGHLSASLRWLQEGSDAVIGPAEDGGYVLLGLNRYADELFQNVPWGDDRVLETTRKRMDGLNWSRMELETLWDLDRPEDLERYLRCRAGVWP